MNRSWPKIYILLFFTVIFSANDLLAQDEPYYHGLPKKTSVAVTKTDPITESTGTSGTGANIDVIYHKVYWRISPDSTKYIKGFVQTNFKTIQNSVSSISFDLRNVLIIDSVVFRGAQLPGGSIVRSGNIVTLTLGATLTDNFIDSFIVYYQGIPPAASGASYGYQRPTSSTAGNYITTLSESYEDRDWWPCKADMQDKIDSMDIIVNVPWASPTAADTFWVATNGKLVDSTIAGTNRTFIFKTRYPIASYLVFVSVAKFNRYYRSVNISGTEVPVVYNLFRGKTTTQYNTILNAMDKMNTIITTFSNKFGDYPFKNEKHGYYDGLMGASGMEHQTMSGMATGSLSSLRTLTHELMHQWFGDNVTFATWNDLWLAEGFARYSESLAAELEPTLGFSSAYSIRNTIKTSALSLTTVSTWIPDANTGTSALIWGSNYGSAIYERGCMIVSMLRAICGDQKFFQALKNYQTSLAGKTATTDSLKNFFNAVLEKDISSFFNDYVGGSGSAATPVGGIGNPVNTVNWNSPSPNKLVVQMASQTTTSGSNVAYFNGPVVLHIRGALPANDTTISFFDWGGGDLSYAGNGLSIPVRGNRLSYYLSFTPTSVAYDDSARTLSTGSTVNVPGLDSYTWLGSINTDWNTAGNWSSSQLPPDGADITIATVASNQPVLQNDITTGPLTINESNTIIIGNNTLTLNNVLKNTGTLTGSPTSNLVIAGHAGTISFNQASAATRSLNLLSLNGGCSAILGTGILELYGGLNLPPSSILTVGSSNLIIH
ncbi:MAG: hypothetical protein HOP10_13570 [Chitinophagaceae bacterium]|nr:hypothetical protein [Chitinophagaceae bacterium]